MIYYLPPEQALDFHGADIRADIYSLGCTFYYLLTGQPPFAGGTMAQKLIKHQQAEPPPIDAIRSDLPAGLSEVLRKMLAKRPDDRYQTPAEVAQALVSLGANDFVPMAMPVVDETDDMTTWATADSGRRQTPKWRVKDVALLLLGMVLYASIAAMLLWPPASKEAAPEPVAVTPPMRNAALQDLPDNSWVRVGPFQGRERGSRGVPWCYDPDLRRFIRVGGVMPGSVASAAQISNEVWSYDLGTKNWTKHLPYAMGPGGTPLMNRPSYGHVRGICYDRDNHCVWDYSCLSFGATGLWKGMADLKAEQWSRVDENKVPAKRQALNSPFTRCVAYDESARRVVCIGPHPTYVYNPSNAHVDEGANAPTFDSWWGFYYVPELKACLLCGCQGGTAVSATFDVRDGKWTTRAARTPSGLTPGARLRPGVSYDRQHGVLLLFGGLEGGKVAEDTWAYDPQRQTWTEMNPAAGPRFRKTLPLFADCMMMTYDEEHNVHLLVPQNWDDEDVVWAYRYKK